ncbi:hypothetical protein LIER_41002 [Lithospermum erythrorhizon]|uniref:Membrane-associated kinase regulator 6 n=1 Tax=Lithospermum erythrorhizon TaxID=34254 RepID=A0AAV3QU08_LITER
MENPQIIASESFSYSWLTIDKKQPSFDVSNPIVHHHLDNDFNFDIPLCNKSHVSLVDANDIFSDGYMIPSSFLSPLRTPSTPSNDIGSSETKLLKKWMKSSTKFLKKCSGFLIPRKSNKVNDLGRKVCEVHRWGTSLKTTPTDSMQGPPSNLAGKSSYDVNSDAIKAAIIHCKKSIEVKDNDLTKEEKDVIILEEDENELITTSRNANGDLVSNSKRKNFSDVSFHNHELPGNVVSLDENSDIEVHDLGSQESDIGSVNSKNHKHNQNKNVIDDCMVDFQPIQPLFYITKENASTLPVALPCIILFNSCYLIC